MFDKQISQPCPSLAQPPPALLREAAFSASRLTHTNAVDKKNHGQELQATSACPLGQNCRARFDPIHQGARTACLLVSGFQLAATCNDPWSQEDQPLLKSCSSADRPRLPRIQPAPWATSSLVAEETILTRQIRSRTLQNYTNNALRLFTTRGIKYQGLNVVDHIWPVIMAAKKYESIPKRRNIMTDVMQHYLQQFTKKTPA